MSLEDHFFVALVEKNIERVKRCLESGANANSEKRSTALIVSIGEDEDNADLVGLLLKYGADPNKEDEDGVTPLASAILSVNVKIVHQLVKAGANVNFKDSSGETPLTLCSIAGDKGVISTLLLDAGANLDDKNDDDLLPLQYACMNDSQDMARVLIEFTIYRNNKAVKPDEIAENETLSSYWDENVRRVVFLKETRVGNGTLYNFLYSQDDQEIMDVVRVENIGRIGELLPQNSVWSKTFTRQFRKGKCRATWMEKAILIFEHSDLRILSPEMLWIIASVMSTNQLNDVVKAAILMMQQAGN